ncbi:MAG: hypothetical protein IKE03_07000, partial [Blautia sp.]|nr:hypothetical protein [Blautia sp.]
WNLNPPDSRNLDPTDSWNLDPPESRNLDPPDSRNLDLFDSRNLDPVVFFCETFSFKKRYVIIYLAVIRIRLSGTVEEPVTEQLRLL